MLRAPSHLLFLVPLLAACAAKPAEPPPAPTAAPEAEPTAAAPAAPVEKHADKLPTECTDKGAKLCLPPQDFVKRLCSGSYPDVALSMLTKGTPWARGWLRVKAAEAWYASGGASTADKIVFEEEFVLLSRREAATGGMQVSGAGGGYDILRWDGSCASLQDEEVSLTPSPAPKHAKIPWKNLDDKIQAALLGDEKINKTYLDRRKECKGATMGDVSAKCVKLDDQLSHVVVDFLRKGGSLPPPPRLP